MPGSFCCGRKKYRCSVCKVAGSLYLNAVGVPGVVGEGNVLDLDYLDGLADGTGSDGEVNGLGLGLLEGLVARDLVIVYELLEGAADLGDGGTYGVCAAEMVNEYRL